jgi:OmpA-OmpF porin, OOP family
MKLKMLMAVVGVAAPGLALCTQAVAAERHPDMVVAQAIQQAAPAAQQKDKDKKPGGNQPAQHPNAQRPAAQQQQQHNPPPAQIQKPAQQQQHNQPPQHPVQMQKQAPQQHNQPPQHPVQMQKQAPQQQPQQHNQPPQRPVQRQEHRQPNIQQSGGNNQPQAAPAIQAPPAARQQAPRFDRNKAPVVQTQPSPDNRRLDQLRQERHETREGNRVVIQENNRTIIRDNGRIFIHHDDTDRFRRGARDVHVERRGNEIVTVVVRPDGDQIITITDPQGRLLQRIRRDRSGREYVLIDNRHRGPAGAYGFIAGLAPPIVHIPRDRYIVDADRADRALLYETLIAPPVMHIDRRYTLDEIRYTNALRERMPRIDLDTITFDTGSWDVTPDQARLLEPIAEAMLRAIRRNPNEVYLIEGHTDLVGNDVDNLSLSDRRAEEVAEILTQEFGIPPENLTTQGYGEQYPKVPTAGPERLNRRVTVRRITPLLMGQN